MSFLLLMSLAWSCDEPSTVDELLQALVSTEREWREGPPTATAPILREAMRCQEERLQPPIVARIYRAVGAGLVEEREGWWRTARELDPGFAWGAHDPPWLATVWPTADLPTPATASLHVDWSVDGRTRTVPVGPGLHVLQHRTQERFTPQLFTGPALPAIARGDDPVPPTPRKRRSPVTDREVKYILHRPREKTPLLVGGGVLLIGSAVALGLGAKGNRNVALGGAAGAVVGLGATTWGVLIHDGPSFRF